MSGERQWRWDGTEWTYWDGEQWVVGQPAPEEIPPTAATTDTPTPTSPTAPTGEVYTFTSNVDTGSVVPADPLAADIAARCSGVFD